MAVKEVAERNVGKGVYYLDTEKALAGASPNHISGRELFYEHVHLSQTTRERPGDHELLVGRAALPRRPNT